MANEEAVQKETEPKETEQEESGLIDPIYQKFVKGILRAIGSTEFYEFFMDSISRANNEFQFSNRRMEKLVDLTWVDIIEDTLGAFEGIVSSPRNVIKEEELIVNVANARKAGSETVRHLAQHASLVEGYNEERGEVRPGRLMQRYREDSIGLYENRLAFTTLEKAYQFVRKRHEALFGEMGDEFGAKLKINSEMDTATEHVHLDMFLHIKETDSALETDRKNAETFARISRMYRVLSVFMNSQFAEQLKTQARVKGTPTKTNVLKKNKSYKKVMALYDFLRQYDDVGYSIKVIEQSPKINETFQRDIFHNILFNYLILKGYLEDEESRTIPAAARGRKRTLKPKFIRQVIEELTEDYDLPDVEVRKVLIEELTKAQLMQEEKEERRRLVEEQQQRKKAEEERLRAEKEAEKERLRAEREAEKERKRQEKEAEEQRKLQERMEREIEDRRVAKLMRGELDRFREELPEQLRKREEQAAAAATLKEQEDYADAVTILEEAERREREERARERLRRKEEKEQAERERLAAEEKARLEAEAEAARLAEEQRQKDEEAAAPYRVELAFFMNHLAARQELRRAKEEKWRQELEAMEQAKASRRGLRKR